MERLTVMRAVGETAGDLSFSTPRLARGLRQRDAGHASRHEVGQWLDRERADACSLARPFADTDMRRMS